MLFRTLLIAVLVMHVVWISFVLFGVLLTHGRPFLTGVHLLALVWGILVEIGPWPCPLTLAELSLDAHAGLPAYGGGYVAHILDALIYPNLPDWLITTLGVSVCMMNLAVYARRLQLRRAALQRTTASTSPS